MTSLQEILQQENNFNIPMNNNILSQQMNNHIINQPPPQQLNNSQIESITQDLNNMKKDDDILNNNINSSDNLTPDDLFNENKKTYKSILINFIIVLIVYLVFSTDFIKQIFSNIIIGIYPNGANISLIGLFIYGSVIAICCSLLNYKFNE